MRIVAHNMLKCNIRGVENGFPLKIEYQKLDIVQMEFNRELITRLVTKINLAALKSAALDLGISGQLMNISELDPNVLTKDEETLKEIHHLLFEVHVMEGNLVCPESGRKFPIKDGIPNMLLHEDEV